MLPVGRLWGKVAGSFLGNPAKDYSGVCRTPRPIRLIEYCISCDHGGEYGP